MESSVERRGAQLLGDASPGERELRVPGCCDRPVAARDCAV